MVVFIQIITRDEVINLTLEEVKHMQVSPGYLQVVPAPHDIPTFKFERNAEVTFRCDKVTQFPRIKESNV